MRNELCRRCGNDLEVALTCSVCQKPTQYHCNNCNNYTEEEIHFQCFKISFEQELLKINQA